MGVYRIEGTLGISGPLKIFDPDGNEVKNLTKLEIILDAVNNIQEVTFTRRMFDPEIEASVSSDIVDVGDK